MKLKLIFKSSLKVALFLLGGVKTKKRRESDPRPIRYFVLSVEAFHKLNIETD